MTIPQKNTKNKASCARHYRRSTKPRTPLPPQFPRGSPSPPATRIPSYQAASLPPSYFTRKYISPDSPPSAQLSRWAYSALGASIMDSQPASSSSNSQVSLSFVNTVNKFGLEILSHKLTFNGTKSTGLCAMNIYHCLSMVSVGSKDNNLQAFAKVLGFSPESLNAMVDNTLGLDRYSKSSTEVDFSSASAIFPDKNFKLEKTWKKTIREKFEAEVGPLEVKSINAFIERETKGKLKDVLKPGDVDGAVLALVSCLYFKAKWASPFNSSDTKIQSTFYGFEKNQKCDLMYKNQEMDYFETANAQVVILPYQSGFVGPQWKAAVVLPKEEGVDAMHTLLASLSAPDVLRNLLVGSDYQTSRVSSSSRPTKSHNNYVPERPKKKIFLYLPRFSLRLSLNLKPVLDELGLRPAFIPSKDFAPISKVDDLMISRVTHDLFLEVNESGTEMAAATVVVMRKKRALHRPTVMQVDRPFLFMVFDATTGLALCSAVVCEDFDC